MCAYTPRAVTNVWTVGVPLCYARRYHVLSQRAGVPERDQRVPHRPREDHHRRGRGLRPGCYWPVVPAGFWIRHPVSPEHPSAALQHHGMGAHGICLAVRLIEKLTEDMVYLW